MAHCTLGKAGGDAIEDRVEPGLERPQALTIDTVSSTGRLSCLARGLAESVVGTGITVNSVLPGPSRSEGVGVFLQQMAQQQGIDEAEMERRFFETARPSSFAQALSHNRRSRQCDRVSLHASGLRHDRFGIPCRWRCCARDPLKQGHESRKQPRRRDAPIRIPVPGPRPQILAFEAPR